MRTRGPLALGATAVLAFGLVSCADLGGLDLDPVGAPDKNTYVKLALNQSESHPSYIALENLSERFEERTDG